MKTGLLVAAGSIDSLGANVAVSERTVIGRVIAEWQSFALTGRPRTGTARWAGQALEHRAGLTAHQHGRGRAGGATDIGSCRADFPDTVL